MYLTRPSGAMTMPRRPPASPNISVCCALVSLHIRDDRRLPCLCCLVHTIVWYTQGGHSDGCILQIFGIFLDVEVTIPCPDDPSNPRGAAGRPVAKKHRTSRRRFRVGRVLLRPKERERRRRVLLRSLLQKKVDKEDFKKTRNLDSIHAMQRTPISRTSRPVACPMFPRHGKIGKVKYERTAYQPNIVYAVEWDDT